MSRSALDDRPSLVFIHGTSGYKKPGKWLTPLNRTLHKRGMKTWNASDVPKVRYERQLQGPKDSTALSKRVGEEPPAQMRATFEANRAVLSAILADFGTTKGAMGAAFPELIRRKVAKHGRARAFKATAERYRRRRGLVCQQVLEQAGPGDLILIGYSLGSVVAADLLSRLSPDQHVRLLVTIGSPLGAGSWDRTMQALRPFPYDKLDAWVNIHNRRDWVTGRVGLEGRIPQAIDVRIGRFSGEPRLKKRPLAQHRVGGYTSHAALAAAIGWAINSTQLN